MNRQWMYGDRHTSEYIKGVHDFLEVPEANKQNGFMCCPCPICGNTKSYSDRKILHTHLLYKGFMPHYNVWTRHGEIGVMMEDIEEEEDDDNYVPPYGDAATGGAAEDQEEPDDVPDDDDLRRVIVDARTQCESQKEKLKFDRMLEDHKKRFVPQLRRWQHKARYRTGIAAVEGRECYGWQRIWEAIENIEEEASKG